jgi:hypothetical protein
MKAQCDMDKRETVYVAGRLRKGWLERLGRSTADLVYIPPFCDGREWRLWVFFCVLLSSLSYVCFVIDICPAVSPLSLSAVHVITPTSILLESMLDISRLCRWLAKQIPSILFVQCGAKHTLFSARITANYSEMLHHWFKRNLNNKWVTRFRLFQKNKDKVNTSNNNICSQSTLTNTKLLWTDVS